MLTSSILNFKKTKQSLLFFNSSHSGRNYSDFTKYFANLSINDMKQNNVKDIFFYTWMFQQMKWFLK